MGVSPGSGQDQAVLPLAEAGLLEPLGEASATVVTDASRDLVYLDDQQYGQPTDLVAIGMTRAQAARDRRARQAPDADSLSLIGVTSTEA